MRSLHGWFPCVMAGLLGLSGITPAAEPAASTPEPDRWLLIVDTSAAMERRAKAVEGVLTDLLGSGMSGQMHAGDELGIWTFNKELFSGLAPMQVWQPGRTNLITRRTVGFVGRQTYGDKARFAAFQDELGRLVKSSRRLTVVLISDGSGEVSGTPFDDAINNSFASHRADMAKTRMPLITILRAQQGTYLGQHVSLAPWPVEFPAFPPEPPKINAVPASEAPVKPVEMKPIIITGGPKKLAQEVQSNEVAAPSPSKAVESTPVAAPSDSAGVVQLPSAPAQSPAPTPAPVAAAKNAEQAPESSTTPRAPVVSATPARASVAELLTPTNGASAAAASAGRVAPEQQRAGQALSRGSEVSVPPPASVGLLSIGEETVTVRKWPLIIGIGLMWVAILSAFYLVRRARKANATSLITQSFEQRPH
jgi:hypothetical protein